MAIGSASPTLHTGDNRDPCKQFKLNSMKNLFLYYVLILTPIGILFWLNKADLIGGTLFMIFLLIYVLIYRTFIDGFRLFKKNIIEKKDIWKLIIPGSRLGYLKELYLK